MQRWAALAGLLIPLVASPAAGQQPALDVRVVTDEADAVLAILDQRVARREPAAAAWQRLFATEGYRRLQQRETAMRRAFTDSAFREFVRSPDLLARAPAHARIRASVYPVIKPRTNSFVFEPQTNPAIFLYLDPAVTAPKFANTLAHELHHLGYANACPDAPPDSTVPPGVRDARDWMGGFAEGRAMLAAAGGPDVHPHATSDSAERAVWERDVALVPRDLARLEAFYVDLLDGRLSEEAARDRGFTFVSTDSVPQGAFYTVGWTMAAVVERELGRERLVASTCTPAALLADYNRAAARIAARGESPPPRWSEGLLVRLGTEMR